MFKLTPSRLLVAFALSLAAGCQTYASTGGGGSSACAAGETRSCYSGPEGTKGLGSCVAGKQSCTDEGVFGPCEGEVVPQAESCALPGDEDCDGTANEADAGCVCEPGAIAPCYSGPDGTSGVGLCAAGTHVCDVSGEAWGACEAEVLPADGECKIEAADANCDGHTCGLGELGVTVTATQDQFVQRIVPAPGGGFYFAGTSNGVAQIAPAGTNVGSVDTDLFVAKANPDGSIAWAHTLYAAGIGSPAAIGDLLVGPLGEAVLVGSLAPQVELELGAEQIIDSIAGGFVGRILPDGTPLSLEKKVVQGINAQATQCAGGAIVGDQIHLGCVSNANLYTLLLGQQTATSVLVSGGGVSVTSMLAGESGKLLVAGTFSGSLGNPVNAAILCDASNTYDAYVAQIDPSAGSLTDAVEWLQCFQTQVAGPEFPHLAARPGGGAFVGLSIKDGAILDPGWGVSADGVDAVVAALDASGAVVDLVGLGGAGDQFLQGIAWDGTHLVAAGHTTGAMTGFGGGLSSAQDAWVASIDGSLKFEWGRTLAGPVAVASVALDDAAPVMALGGHFGPWGPVATVGGLSFGPVAGETDGWLGILGR